MVQMPSGQFQMGGTQKTNEEPIHTVEIGSFWMDVKPVTVSQFRKFVAATQHPTPIWNHISVDSPTDDHPIIYVSWFDAMVYAEWSLADCALDGQNLQTMAGFLSHIINQC